MKTLFVEVMESLTVERTIELLRSVMGPWYDFRHLDATNNGSRPVFVRLSFDSHAAACAAYDQLMLAIHGTSAVTDTSVPKSRILPLSVQWLKTAWYYQVAGKEKQMEYNAQRLTRRVSAGPDDKV